MERQELTFVGGYMQRLQERRWLEKEELYSACPHDASCPEPSDVVKVGSRKSTILSTSRASLSELKGHAHFSSLKQDLGHQSIPSKSSPRQPLLEKRYKYHSTPALCGARLRRKVHSPSTGKKSFRKIKRSSTTYFTSSSPSYRSSIRGTTDCTSRKHITKSSSAISPSSSLSSRYDHSLPVSLPHVNTQSNKTESEKIWELKPYSCGRDVSPQDRLRQKRRESLGERRLQYDGTSDHHAGFHRHKRFPSAGVGVAKRRGHGLDREGWGGVDCYCESIGDELMSSAGEIASPEDAINEEGNESSLAEGEEEGEEGEGGGGFSDCEDDLTDLDEGDSSSCSSSHENLASVELERMERTDPVTYGLLQRTCRRLQEMSVEERWEGDRGEEEGGVEVREGGREGGGEGGGEGRREEEAVENCGWRLRGEVGRGRCGSGEGVEGGGGEGGPKLTKPDHNKQVPSTIDHHQGAEKEGRGTLISEDGRTIKDGDTRLPDSPLSDRETADDALSSSLPSPSSALSLSLFPGCPASLHFPLLDEPFTPLPQNQRSLLQWKMSTITPNVVKSCVARAGFSKCTKGNYWLGYWGKHMRSQAFRGVRPHQKVNHFPGSFQIGRKDRLWRNLAKMQGRVGKKDLDFIPLTFVLPHDLSLLKREWEKGDRRQKWILKPPAAARGIGVKVIHKWNQFPKKKPLIVQRYISDPFLINRSKFDLRVYVYVSSYDPLRIYVFKDGLARFATCRYSSSTRSLSNRFMHLTNYSVNKRNTQFTQNPDETQCQGHKWGLLALWQYMDRELKIDTEAIWDSIKELVIKTIICSEPYCSSLVKACVQSSYSCHELFGFDIMLDRRLKPWIIEVNISPSLHSNSQLDVNIKGRLVRDLLNMAGFRLPDKESLLNGEKTYTHTHSYPLEERHKRTAFLQKALPEYERRKILDNLTRDDLTILMQSEDEFARRGMFERVFPSPTSSKYRKFFESEKYYNILLEQWILKYHKQPMKGVRCLQRLAQPSQ